MTIFIIFLFPLPYLSRARRTPSLSTRSGLSLRPAVSLSRTGNPPMSSAVSTMSLVVPAMGDTMAAGLWPGCKKVTGWQLLSYYSSYCQKIPLKTHQNQQYPHTHTHYTMEDVFSHSFFKSIYMNLAV